MATLPIMPAIKPEDDEMLRELLRPAQGRATGPAGTVMVQNDPSRARGYEQPTVANAIAPGSLAMRDLEAYQARRSGSAMPDMSGFTPAQRAAYGSAPAPAAPQKFDINRAIFESVGGRDGQPLTQDQLMQLQMLSNPALALEDKRAAREDARYAREREAAMADLKMQREFGREDRTAEGRARAAELAFQAALANNDPAAAAAALGISAGGDAELVKAITPALAGSAPQALGQEDVKAMALERARRLAERDAATFGFDPNMGDVNDLVSQRDDLAVSIKASNPRISADDARRAANKLIDQELAKQADRLGTGWIQTARQALGLR